MDERKASTLVRRKKKCHFYCFETIKSSLCFLSKFSSQTIPLYPFDIRSSDIECGIILFHQSICRDIHYIYGTLEDRRVIFFNISQHFRKEDKAIFSANSINIEIHFFVPYE